MVPWILAPAPWLNVARVDPLSLISRLRPSLQMKPFFTASPYHRESPSMLAIRRVPYPSSGMPTLVFEDITREYDYGDANVATVAKANTTMSASSYGHGVSNMVLELVRQKNYVKAAHVHKELEALGVPFRKSFIYAKPARRQLTLKLPEEERVRRFAWWWTLVPEGKIQDRLLWKFLGECATPSSNLVAHFALTVAERGEATSIAATTIPIVMRHAHVSDSVIFLEKFKVADFRYRLDHTSPNTLQRIRSLREHLVLSARWYGSALQAQLAARRLPAAVDLFCCALKAGISISPLRYAKLRALLQHVSNDEGITRIDLAWRQAGQSALPALPKPERTPLIQPRKTFVLAWSAFQSLLSHGNVSSQDFKEFTHRHNFENDPGSLIRFRRRLFNTTRSAKTRSAWLIAEMQTYVEQRQEEALFKLFAHHFYAVGIPKYAVRRVTRILEEEKESVKLKKTIRRFPGRRHDRRSRRRWLWIYAKMSPGVGHVGYIWRWTLSNLRTARQYHHFYKELLLMAKVRIAEGAATGETSQIMTQEVEKAYAEPPATPHLIHVHLFNHFLEAFFNRKYYGLACLVPADMQQLGIAPNIATCRILIRGFATCKDAERTATAIRLLRNVTGKHKKTYHSVMGTLLVRHDSTSSKHRVRIIKKALRLIDEQT